MYIHYTDLMLMFSGTSNCHIKFGDMCNMYVFILAKKRGVTPPPDFYLREGWWVRCSILINLDKHITFLAKKSTLEQDMPYPSTLSATATVRWVRGRQCVHCIVSRIHQACILITIST